MRLSYYILIICFTIIFINGCTGTRYLREDQYLLYKNSIEGYKNISRENYTAHYQQKPNKNIFGFMPGVAIYNYAKSKFDTAAVNNEILAVMKKYDTLIVREENERKKSKIIKKKDKKLEALNTQLREGNWVMRNLGEAPSIYDSSLTEQTEKQLKYFLNSESYFESSVQYKVDTVGRWIKVSYTINEGSPFKIKEINYVIKDPVVKSIILESQKNSPLKVGDKYKEENITAERERINKELKNNGYFDFTRQYIFFEIDTTVEKASMMVDVLIENPPNEETHKRYTIDKIIFNTDVSTITTDNIKRDTSFYKNIYYVFYDRRFSKKILNTKLRLSPGMLYSENKIQKSQRKLAALDMYKFININFEKNKKDTVNNSLTAYINASPLKRYQITDEIGLTVGQGYVPGPFGSITYKERNVLKGFEVFEIGLRMSIAGQSSLLDPTNVLTNKEYGINTSLTFPQLFFPTQIRHRFDDYDPKTKLITAYNIVIRPEYSRDIIKAALNYTFVPSKYTQVNIAPFDLNLIHTIKTSEPFDAYLKTINNRILNLNFGKSVNSDMNASYVFNNNEIGTNKKSKYFRIYVESGGTSLNLLNKTPLFAKNDSILNLRTFRYVKINPDVRFYFPVNKNTFAMRFTVGYAFAYGKDRVMPYEKYFFSGGSNSIRAWQPRRLGPGTFVDSTNRNPDGSVNYSKKRRPEQPGEILFETNYEYRFKIIKFFNGAFFVDAGNVWNLRKNETRPGAEFRLSQLYNQIAVGTGFGLRMDFSFLILRFDLGIKVIDPGELPGRKFVLYRSGIKTSVINIGIGYPF